MDDRETSRRRDVIKVFKDPQFPLRAYAKRKNRIAAFGCLIEFEITKPHDFGTTYYDIDAGVWLGDVLSWRHLFAGDGVEFLESDDLDRLRLVLKLREEIDL